MTTASRTYDSYNIASQEDRCAPRTQLKLAAALRPSGSTRFVVVVQDLSVAGFACEAVSGMRPGTICWLNLPGMSGLQAEVIWNNGSVIGCAFASLLNPAVLESILMRGR
jgi:hypothetical protein